MCCGTTLALPATSVVLSPFSVVRVDVPIGEECLTAGQLSYPLLRPPSDLI